jgi:hypothetical protein
MRISISHTTIVPLYPYVISGFQLLIDMIPISTSGSMRNLKHVVLFHLLCPPLFDSDSRTNVLFHFICPLFDSDPRTNVLFHLICPFFMLTLEPTTADTIDEITH